MSDNNPVTAIILAAGKGTRMKSKHAKVLHEVFYKPMLTHVLDSLHRAGINDHIVILGHQRERVADAIGQYSYLPVFQEEQLGTGHAVLCAESACAGGEGLVMILCGDTPLLRSETLERMVQCHLQNGAAISLMTTHLDDPFGYGRIIGDDNGNIYRIVEEKDADSEQRRLTEINAGVYLVDRQFLFSALKQVGTDNSQGEVYLTDIVRIANDEGLSVRRFFHPEAIDVLGVNSRVELARAHTELQKRRNRELMLGGVTMYQPESVFIGPDVLVGSDVLIFPGVQVSGASKIGDDCVIETGSQLHDCTLEAGAVVGAYSILRGMTLSHGTLVPPQTCQFGD
ncbi:MAG: NTP transferase domain-containing protein [Desulfobulbaceae bacterium]|nr:NTP transferase domain-containing protein [Desulfobulbaceae bacterium]